MADLDENIVELQTLFIDQRAPILFVGEGNFTFSMAFAAMRGTWDGIISTTLETSLPHIEEVKDMTLLALTMNKYSGESINDADFIVRREKISSLSNDALRDWRAAIDATRDLSQFKSQRNIWFQCPWDWSPVKLLKDFVSHCSTFQQPGDLLLIGIVYKDYSKFYEKYDLKNFLNLKPKELDSLFEYSRNTRDTSLILNGNNSFINQKDYELLYPDKCLVKEILVHGYFHKSVNGNDNLHRQFHRDNIHRTIVLRKKLGVEDIISPLTELKFDQVTDNCQNNLANKNVKFVEEVDETMISTQNFIVAQNLTTEVKQLCEKHKKNFVFLFFSNYEAAPLNISDSESTAVFDIVVQQPVFIDKVMDHLPQTSIKAYLYLPNAPNHDEVKKIRFFSQLALDRKCPLASSWTLERFHVIAKLATNYENILFCNTSFEITRHFLTKLNYYRNIYISGSEELKNLIASGIEEKATELINEKKD